MVIVKAVLGNIKDPSWQAKLSKMAIDRLVLNQWDAQKNRFRRTTEQGKTIAVSLDRNVFLQDGDILAWNEVNQELVVAQINLSDVMVIKLGALAQGDLSSLIRSCVELGHALGNQHWPAVVKDQRVYVPLTIDRKVMDSVMRTHAFQNVTYDFIPGLIVIPYLSPHETRRLFGGAEQSLHRHSIATEASDDRHHDESGR